MTRRDSIGRNDRLRGLACARADGVRAARTTALATVVLGVLGAVAGGGCQSGPPPSLVEQGDAAYAQGEYRAADALYARALTATPGLPAALHGRARVSVVQRNPEVALRLHGELAKADPGYWRSAARADYALALFEAGKSRLGKGQAAGAVRALRALRKVDSEWPRLDGWLARALTAHAAELSMHGRRKEALALFEEAAQLDPASTPAYVGAAEILIGSGRKKEALELLEVAREIDPGDRRVRALTMEAMGLY